MKSEAGKAWDVLHTNYWFIPSVMGVSSVGLFLLTFFLQDRLAPEFLEDLPFVFRGDIEGARAVLSVVATSMATMAGVVFSIMIVVLTLASQQLGPRLLMNYMRDTGTQFALGTFIATFIYSLLSLRTVKGDEINQTAFFLPVTISVMLLLLSLGVFIYYINHITELAQASTMIDAVAEKLDKAIIKLFPEDIGKGGGILYSSIIFPKVLYTEGARIRSVRSGYVQIINSEGLLELAGKNDIVVRLIRIPGDFVALGEPIAEVRPLHGNITFLEHIPALEKSLNGLYILGRQRTDVQDAAFLLEQLVEIASRALSPGINDPFTAVMCIDRIGDALARIAGRSLPLPFRFDDENNFRVISPSTGFVPLLENTFAPVRTYGSKSLMVLKRLLEVIGFIAAGAHRGEDIHALALQARLVLVGGMEGLTLEEDRRVLIESYQDILSCIKNKKLEVA